MSRQRGRPAQGTGLARDDILSAALKLLVDGGGHGLTMRSLANQLGITPMSLYHHVGNQAELLRTLSDLVYAEVLEAAKGQTDSPTGSRDAIRTILMCYHHAVSRYSQLTLAIFATPEAFAGVTRHITDTLTTLLQELTTEPVVWRDILVDHAHGSGLAFAAVQDEEVVKVGNDQYQQAVDRLLDVLETSRMLP